MIDKGRVTKYKKLREFCWVNKLKLWDELNYWRYWDWLISVTEMLSILVDPWFEFIKKNHSDKLKKACDKWTMIHEAIELDAKLDMRWAKNKEQQMVHDYMKTYKSWKIIHMIDIEHKEKTYVKDWIRWTIDAISDWWHIIDYKTSRRKNNKYMLQIAAYCWLSWLESWSILYMNEEWFDYIEVENIEYYIDIFKELIDYSKTILNFNIKK